MHTSRLELWKVPILLKLMALEEPDLQVTCERSYRDEKWNIKSESEHHLSPHLWLHFLIHYTVGDTPSVSSRAKVYEGRCDHISRHLFHITWLALFIYFFSSWKFTLKQLPWACGFLEGRFSLWQGHLLIPETSWWPQSDLCPGFGIWKQLHRILHQFS